MSRVILDYRNLPGRHCGSAAMKNLIHHFCNLDITEAAAFGLGSGIDSIYIENEKSDPQVLALGRGVTLEIDLTLALGIDYQETTELDNETAWQQVRKEIVEGRPTMLTGDPFYLDFRKFHYHFPSHRFVLVGFDDEKQLAYIADRVDPEPQPCSFAALANDRNSSSTISTFNLWGKFHSTEVTHSLVRAYELALEKTAKRMLGHDSTQGDLIRMVAGNASLTVLSGLEALARYADQVTTWQERPNAVALTNYAGLCIEKFGTGGGNFRTLYADFLREAHDVLPDRVDESLPGLADQSSALWTEVSDQLSQVNEENLGAALQRASELLTEILALETRLFETMAGNIA